jgi:hypothetical protein
MYTLDDLLLKEPYLEIEGNSNILKKFLELGEDNIEREVQRIKGNIPQAVTYNIEQGETETKNFISALINNIDEKTQYEVHIRQRLRQSIILQLYSFLEFYLTKQCFIYKDINSLNIGLENIKGDGDLDKIKKYYRNYINQDISSNITRWHFILNFKLLRNKIMHSQGKFTDLNTYNKLATHASKNTYSLIKENTSSYYRIEITDNFTVYCIDEVSEFLKEFTIKKAL